MELIDSEDQVAVGDQFTYTIKVLNQSEGNSLHNMTIVGLLPGEMTYVSADGATTFTVVGQEVRFGAVAGNNIASFRSIAMPCSIHGGSE